MLIVIAPVPGGHSMDVITVDSMVSTHEVCSHSYSFVRIRDEVSLEPFFVLVLQDGNASVPRTACLLFPCACVGAAGAERP